MGNRIRVDFTFDDSTKTKGKYLVFDIETTGFPINKNAPPDDFNNWPYVVQIAWLLLDDEQKLIEHNNTYIKQSVLIPADATKIHGITTEMMLEKGIEPSNVYASFKKAVDNTKYIICHNVDFDIPIVHCEFLRNGMKWDFPNDKMLCTMKTGANFCRIPLSGGEYKWPKLTELYQKCFYPRHKMSIFPDATSTTRSLHDANIDACMTAKCFFKMIEHGFFKELKTGIIEDGSPTVYFENNKERGLYMNKPIDVPGWSSTVWGMKEEEILKLVPDAKRLNPPEERGGPQDLDRLAANLRWNGLKFMPPPAGLLLPGIRPWVFGSMPRRGSGRPDGSGDDARCRT